eukprot:3940640-Rhodomonas_salina.4
MSLWQYRTRHRTYPIITELGIGHTLSAMAVPDSAQDVPYHVGLWQYRTRHRTYPTMAVPDSA